MKPGTLAFAGFLLSAVVSATAFAADKPKPEAACTTTREYIVALEFLRAQTDFQIPEPEARKLASKISSGCTGAAQRFARITKVLNTAGMGANDSIRLGSEFAARSDAEAETFTQVFATAVSADHLDMDIRSSVQMAQALSTEFQGDVLLVRQDFQTLAKYCLDSKSLDLPRPDCAALAVRIARKGQSFNGGIARTYIETLEFLRSSGGANLTTADAMKTAEQLMDGGPTASENFITAYRYASAEHGLAFTNRDAVQFAHELALKK